MRNVNCNVLSAANSVTATGIQIDANQLATASFVAVFGDTSAAGVFKIQASNDICNDRYQAAAFIATHWVDIPTITINVASGASKVLTIPYSCYRWLRAVFVPTAPSVAASLVEQDITYTAKQVGTVGNAITVTYVDPGVANQPLSVSVIGNDITVNLATGGTRASKQEEDIILTAVAYGSVGNAITIEYIDTGIPSQPLSVAVVGSAIQVTLGLNILAVSNTTGTAVKALLDATPAVTALVTVGLSGTPNNIQTAAGPDNLFGGTEPLISTATQIAAAILASTPASVLVLAPVTGTGSNVQTASGPDSLAGGTGGYSTVSVNLDALGV